MRRKSELHARLWPSDESDWSEPDSSCDRANGGAAPACVKRGRVCADERRPRYLQGKVQHRRLFPYLPVSPAVIGSVFLSLFLPPSCPSQPPWLSCSINTVLAERAREMKRKQNAFWSSGLVSESITLITPTENPHRGLAVPRSPTF